MVKLKRAILAFYTQYRLFPTGVVSELDSVQDWADKCSKALKRLVPSNKIQILFVMCSWVEIHLDVFSGTMNLIPGNPATPVFQHISYMAIYLG